MAELSPMMRQYFEIKEQYPNTVLFFRLGDFYEMFFEDAKIASSVLELVLTGRDCGQEERAPMCGIPYHSCEGYISKLVANGYKVAICEQTEDPAKAKGIVKREVIRVITPGTVTESSMLDEGCNNYLACVCKGESSCGVCFADVSTGEVHVTELANDPQDAAVINELGRFTPREVLLNKSAAESLPLRAFLKERLECSAEVADETAFEPQACEALLCSHFQAQSIADLGLPQSQTAVCALGCTLGYLRETQKTDLENIKKLDYYNDAQFMKLDISARRNLELLETLRNKEKRGSLLWVLDKTKTAMGKRLIRSWIEQPLLSCAQIIRRQNAVGELFADSMLCGNVTEALTGIYDLERLMTRVVYGTAGARELKSLSYTIEHLPEIKNLLAGCKTALLREIEQAIDSLTDVRALIEAAIVEEPPITIREGGIIKAGYNAEVDTLCEAMNDGKKFITRVEEQEQERTGIKKLKVGYNRVFGYYIEVTNAYKEMVPEEYIRKQTLSSCERYITQELKELEAKVLGAKERVVQLEYELFVDVRAKVAENLHRIQSTAQAIARLDVLASFAQTALQNHYVQPDIVNGDVIEIRDGRHPVVELMLDGVPFVPNDTDLNSSSDRVAIITGPNMAGKSTYMRQVAIITLMAQIGSFVPASSAKIGIVDSIFTRVGASDDLASGQSTFMVEMSEVAAILKNATPKSLLILDEIGRGTSTFDGMSIARAVLEYVADKKKLGAKTLFSTHYHELTSLEETLDGVKNYNIAVKKRGENITFLRRIIRGGADDSFGVDVAKLAGIPDSVVKRARAVLKQLESEGKPEEACRPAATQPQGDGQIDFFSNAGGKIVDRLKTVDVDTLTPIEAMNLLYELAKEAKEL